MAKLVRNPLTLPAGIEFSHWPMSWRQLLNVILLVSLVGVASSATVLLLPAAQPMPR